MVHCQKALCTNGFRKILTKFKLEKESLNKIIHDFNYDSLFPKIGLELEFYLTKNNQQISDSALIDGFITKLSQEIKIQKINLLNIEKEQGIGQIEIKTIPTKNLVLLCQEINLVKKIAQNLAKKNGLKSDFRPVPFIDDCSSALQVNLTILNKDKQNLFVKIKEKESEILLNAIGGLIALTAQNMRFFADVKKDKERFDLERNRQLFMAGKYTAPVNLSWGYDNRSCAIRVVGKEENRRLEYRIPSASADPLKAISKFIEIVFFGIKNKAEAPEPIYGNAFDKKYLINDLHHDLQKL